MGRQAGAHGAATLNSRRSKKSSASHNSYSRRKNSHPSRLHSEGTARVDFPEIVRMLVHYEQQILEAQQQIETLTARNRTLETTLKELEHKEAHARHLALHDELTGLPNRSLLFDRFNLCVSQADRHHKPLAIILLDLDKFKTVNDCLGHAVGDKLLQAVATRLSAGLRGMDTVCRYGGDEFVLMLPDLEQPSVVNTLLADICDRIGSAYVVNGHGIRLSASAGAALYPGDGQTCEELLEKADKEMYRVKYANHKTCVISPSTDNAFAAPLTLYPCPHPA